MKAILVIDIPNEYADRYNVNEMYVWSMAIQDKQGYQMFDLTTDKPNHLKPLPRKAELENYSSGLIGMVDTAWMEGYNECLEHIVGRTK